MKRAALLALLPIAALGACRGGEAPVEPAVDARIARIVGAIVPSVVVRNRGVETTTLEARMAQLAVPGVSIAVIRDGAIDWARGYGMADLEGGRPVTERTLFQAASLSKPLSALAALRLVAEGKLDLDGDVNDRLTGWKVPADDRWKAPVTLRGLLSHAAGMTVSGFPGYPRDGTIPTIDQVLEGEGNTEPVRVGHEPSTAHRYSGGGYVVAQRLMTDVSGIPFPALLSGTVLGPLGMTDSTFEQPLPEALHDRAATGYRADGTAVEGKWRVYPEMAAAGLWTTPSDFARYVLAVQKARSGSGDQLLSAEMAAEILTPVIGRHGLGPEVEPDGSRFGHGGANEGYRAVFTAFLDRQDGVVILSNSDSAGPLLREIMITIAREYGWPGIRPMMKDVVELGESTYRGLEGRYEVPDKGDVTIDYADGKLWADIPGGQRVELLPESDKVFFMRHDGRPFIFTSEGDSVTGFESAGIRAHKVAPLSP